jgi:cellulose synthase/poly-beta-1,6-N-acetylglucosamine synthase-like glycosyltransferase
VVFVPEPTAWTEAPESFRELGRQRDRWQRGLADVIVRHWRLTGRPRYGALGLVAFPYFILIELLGPVIEVIGMAGLVLAIVLGVVDPSFAALFFLVSYGWGLPLSIGAVLLDEIVYRRYSTWSDRALLVLWALLENLGYRHCTVYWRARGMVRYLKGSREWGAMTRKGFDTDSS